MVTRGRNICNTLKAIRKQIADANEIEYSHEECHFKGECKVPSKCEQRRTRFGAGVATKSR